MDLQSLAIIAVGLLLYLLLSGRLRDTIITAPLARTYARLTASMGECEENMPAVEIPLREGHIDKINQRVAT